MDDLRDKATPLPKVQWLPMASIMFSDLPPETWVLVTDGRRPQMFRLGMMKGRVQSGGSNMTQWAPISQPNGEWSVA